MRVRELRNVLEALDDDCEVYMRCYQPLIGNCREVKKVTLSSYGFMGESITCLMVEPFRDDDDDVHEVKPSPLSDEEKEPLPD